MEIKFKGKTVEDGKWLEGNVQVPKPPFDKYFMWDDNNWQQQISPETIGQFIGLSDKNNKKFFVGDLFEYKEHTGYRIDSFIAVVIFDEEKAAFGYRVEGQKSIHLFSRHDELKTDFLDYCEIIGSSHDQDTFV